MTLCAVVHLTRSQTWKLLWPEGALAWTECTVLCPERVHSSDG